MGFKDFTLGFNIDHVATLRNARGEGYPSVLEAASVAVSAGVSQITAHLREDRRHIKDKDVVQLKGLEDVNLNLEMAVTEEMLQIAESLKPHSVCLVPERREELTTEGGLNLAADNLLVQSAVKRLQTAGIKVALFIDVTQVSLDAAAEIGCDAVEFNTGTYANSSSPLIEAYKIAEAAKFVTALDIAAHAGHGLNFQNVTEIAKIAEITEFNIGHFIVSNALFCGLKNTLITMQELILAAKSGTQN